MSLVSKIGFFLRPDKFVPLDRFSVMGLNVLRVANGEGKLKGNVYTAYLDAFDEHYTRGEPQLEAALKEPWVVEMARRLFAQKCSNHIRDASKAVRRLSYA